MQSLTSITHILYVTKMGEEQPASKSLQESRPCKKGMQ